jgi:hypothetical protein
MRSIKTECLDRIVPIGERHLRHALAEYVAHYHAERNHQGLGQRLDRRPTDDRHAQPDSATAATRWPRQLLRACGMIAAHNSARRCDRVMGHYGHETWRLTLAQLRSAVPDPLSVGGRCCGQSGGQVSDTR